MQEHGGRISILSGINAEFLEKLYQQFLDRPESVDPEWRAYFGDLQQGQGLAASGGNGRATLQQSQPASPPQPLFSEANPDLGKQSAVFQLINSYRTFGHTRASLDPLGRPHMVNPPDLSLEYFGLDASNLDTRFATGTLEAPEVMPLKDILDKVSTTYCSSIGAEFMLIRNQQQRNWLAERMESISNQPSYGKDTKRRILTKLVHSELFEKFLATKFVGQKRFSLEGAETLIVLLDGLVESAANLGAEEVVFGMSHRGRLNTLVNTLEKKPEHIFAEFDDNESEAVNELTGSGDVKYHKGYSSDLVTRDGHQIHLSLTFNPSHLEAVNPVVEGNVRAKQDRRGDVERSRIIPVLIHGDAAFAGQGLVQETLNLSNLEGYATGGTVHIIVNNQIGFTTNPRDSRSFLYPSDVCKMLNIPVLHVNGDDPEAVLHVTRLAMGFRAEYHSDIVIDLFCYRRLGHNEMDEPRFTQPMTYKLISKHPSILTVYKDKLRTEGTFTSQEMEEIEQDYRKTLDSALEVSRNGTVRPLQDTLQGAWSGLERGKAGGISKTVVTQQVVKEVGRAINTVPEGFNPHPRLKKLLQTRADMCAGKHPIDWGCGELLAYGSLVIDGFNVRLSGQDSSRGTFTHRHANLVDIDTGADYLPLEHIAKDQGRFQVVDSPLSEAGVLGFEFGYTLADPMCLTIWEAQFGDFANGAQVIIDQFITSSEEKWLRMSGLVMLLPHGFEGQGPEHSSARLERFLQMCANSNIQVCNVTTPAQYFHMVRRQLHRKFRKPLVVMSPKSLLRHPRAVSSVQDLVQGRFREVMIDRDQPLAKKIRRIVFCSGKIYYDLLAQRTERKQWDVVLIRFEQLYPFLADQVAAMMERYLPAKEFMWVQEEPANMGAWTFIQVLLQELLPKGKRLIYNGREPSASPATGSSRVHQQEQKRITALAIS